MNCTLFVSGSWQTLVARSTHWLTAFKPKSKTPCVHGTKLDE
jgi:hypothetical protein